MLMHSLTFERVPLPASDHGWSVEVDAEEGSAMVFELNDLGEPMVFASEELLKIQVFESGHGHLIKFCDSDGLLSIHTW